MRESVWVDSERICSVSEPCTTRYYTPCRWLSGGRLCAPSFHENSFPANADVAALKWPAPLTAPLGHDIVVEPGAQVVAGKERRAVLELAVSGASAHDQRSPDLASYSSAVLAARFTHGVCG